MNDFEILGLSKNCTMEDLKRAFRLKSKKYHPDRNDDPYISHLAMIRLNRAYSNIKEQMKDIPPDGMELKNDKNAYKRYKEAITLYQNIHPSQWKRVKDIYNSHAIDTDPEIINTLNRIIDSIALSYQGFLSVINDFPNSCWYNDSKEKINELEKMTLRYAKIRESYSKEISKIERKKTEHPFNTDQ